ncbi:MAG: hypothetical protein WKF41_18135 [Gaiellaceae bacterium]
MSEKLEVAAALFDSAANDLEEAAKHCRTAAGRFRAGEVPRGAAHAWAAHGHVRTALESLDAQAREHARESNP